MILTHRLFALCRRRSRRQGSIIVLAAFAMILVSAFLAFSVDWGYMVVTESELQNAADAGAKSGAAALSTSRDAAIAAAKTWAGKNVAAGQAVAVVTAEDVEIGRWDTTTAAFTVLPVGSSTSPNAVRVTCRRTAARKNALGLFFSPILGTNSADLSARATACIKTSRCGLIIGINSVTMSGGSHIDSYKSANGPYSSGNAGNNGTVCSNGDITMSGSSAIYGDAHPGPGKTVKSSSSVGVIGTISPLSTPLSYPATDPGDASWNNDNGNIPLSTLGKNPVNSKGEFSLSGSDSVNLSPGRYYFSKMSLSGGSNINISGSTEVYVTGDVNLSGGSVTNQSLRPKNLMLFAMGSTCTISGGSAFYGVVYAPTAKVGRSGESDYYGAIIAGYLTLSGGGGIHADESLDSMVLGGGIQHSSLVE